MASGRYANTKKSLLLVTLMILMTQVGYLENLNPWINGEEALDSNDVVAQTSAGTSVMYGNNTQWAPQGPMSTSSIRAQDIIAVSDEVILFQHSGGSNGCLGAYNRYNETSWTPTFATPSGNACTSGTNTFEFLGMIGDITLFTFDEHSGQYRGDSIYAYNLANDTAYRVFQSPMLTYPTYSSFSARVVMVGNSVYMAEYHDTQPGEYKLGVFNFDNQSHWTYDSILPSNCSDQIYNLVVFSETKLLLSCDASWAYSYYVFNIENESMYPVNGLNGSTLNEALSGSDFALVGTKLLFDATTCFSCKRNPWVFDSTNDTAWVVQDVMADANTGFIMNNMMRSGTSVLFTGYGYNYSTSSALPTNLYWYESTNDTIWQATFFTDSALTMNNKHGELANGDIVFKTISGSNEATYFHNPANGSVWQEEALCYGTYGSDCGEFVLIEVYGNTIFGTAKMNRTGSLYGWDSMIAYDFSNKSTQVSWNLGNAPSPQSHMVYNQGFALGDQLLFPYRCAQSTSTTCARVNNGTSTSNDATMIWSPYAIRVNDAWNMSKGEIEGAYDPISGGVGTRYSPGVGVQNLTASVEGADLSIDVPMTNITFQYDASAVSGSGSGSGASQSSFVNNIGLRSTSGSATQSTGGSAITPIEFSLEWDNFTTPSSLSSSETAMFPFDHSVNDTTSTPVENSTLSASNLTYDRHGREMHALDEMVIYEQNLSELAISSDRISLSLWIKPTNVGTEESIIDNHPQYHLRMNADGSLNFRIRQTFSGAWNDHYSSTQLEDDTWYHIGVSASRSSGFVVNFYVNGSLDVQRTTSSSYGFTSSTTSELDLMGPSGNNDGFEGILDDLYVYDAVLSASDFATLMDVGEITWDVSPSLPAGLSLDAFTGTITGTPPASQAAGQYTVYANSSSTSYSRTFDLSLSSGNSICTGTACMVKDINASGNGVFNPLHTVGNTIYFRGGDGTNGIELWKSNGTTSGTMMVKDIWSGSNGGHHWNCSALGWPYVNISNTLYFTANDGTNGCELWKTDGTASGTVMVKDIKSGSGSSFPGSLYAVGNTLYFRADDGTSGYELWKSDGTASGTVMVKDINPGSSNGDISYLTAVGYNFYFRAYNPSTGYELYGTQTVSSVYYA